MQWALVAAVAGPGLEVIGAILLTINIFWREEKIQDIIGEERISKSSIIYSITLWISVIIILGIMYILAGFLSPLSEENKFIYFIVLGLIGVVVAKYSFPLSKKSVADNIIQEFIYKIIVLLSKGNRVRQIGVVGVLLLLVGFVIQSIFNIMALRQIS